MDDVEASTLPPLHEVVDPDALDALVESTGPAVTAGDVAVSFRYAGHDVVVDGEGDVHVDRVPVDQSPDLQTCAHCGDPLESDVWYPVALPETDDGADLYTFCDDDCLDAWRASASRETRD